MAGFHTEPFFKMEQNDPEFFNSIKTDAKEKYLFNKNKLDDGLEHPLYFKLYKAHAIMYEGVYNKDKAMYEKGYNKEINLLYEILENNEFENEGTYLVRCNNAKEVKQHLDEYRYILLSGYFT